MQSKYPKCFPSDLDVLLDKRYVFQYKVTKFFNIDRKNRTYGIKNLSCEESIMDEFNDKQEVNV
jgi:hypothetical protein